MCIAILKVKQNHKERALLTHALNMNRSKANGSLIAWGRAAGRAVVQRARGTGPQERRCKYTVFTASCTMVNHTL